MSKREFWSYLEILCHRAKELGALEAVAIPVTDIVVDERAVLKCLVPRCPFYGTNLTCPPNLMPVSEFKKILKAYHYAILIKIDSASSGLPEGLTRLNDISKAWEITQSAGSKEKQPITPITEYVRVLRDSQKRLYEIITQIESICIREGYCFAAGLSAGACFLCDECVGPKSACRHPFKARPSMEAMAIDVVATAKRAGMRLNFDQDARSWWGLILVD
ncbi:hypothetical protein ES705_37227 [subsurface metagenome]